MNQETKEHPLINRLYRCIEPLDRAQLAALRNGFYPARQWDALRIVLPYVKAYEEDDALLLGALFGLHPQRGDLSVAKAMRRIWEGTGRDSIESRFNTLIAADREDLNPHLRHAVSLIASYEQPLKLDWHKLFEDLRYWSSPYTQRKWARDFWGIDTKKVEDNAPASSLPDEVMT